jgi:dipeptidyl aminopeptidase/acylaminoacyl peptidase
MPSRIVLAELARLPNFYLPMASWSLVDMGYVVIEPNIRGSTGYGVQFRDMALKDWGGADLEDVTYAAQYLQSLTYVDAQRIGVFGGSYGGYMTFMAVTRIRTYQLLADYMQRQL